MIKKLIFSTLLLFSVFIISPLSAYAVAPVSTVDFAGTMSAVANNSYVFFDINGSSNTLNGSAGAEGTITYSDTSNSFGGSISLGGNLGTLSGSGDAITYNPISSSGGSGSITYSSGKVSGTITINGETTGTTNPIDTGGIPTCPSPYHMISGVCTIQTPITFTITTSSTSSGILLVISGGNSSGSITINNVKNCPAQGETINSSGQCVASSSSGNLYGDSSTFYCINTTDNQNIACLSESQNTAVQSTYGTFQSDLINAVEQSGANNWWTQTPVIINWSNPTLSGSNVVIPIPPLGGSISIPLSQFSSSATTGASIGVTTSMADSTISGELSGFGFYSGETWGTLMFPNAESTTPNELCPLGDEQCVTMTQTPSCPKGYTLSSSDNQCTYENTNITVTPSCPSGWSDVNGICSYTTDQYAPTSSGYSLNGSNSECTETINQQPCSTGYTLNTSTGQCSQTSTIPAVCPAGFTGPNSSGACTQTLTTPATCPTGYIISGSQCVTQATSVPATCPSGYSPDTTTPGECIEISTLAPTCPDSSYILDPTTGMCNLTQYKVPLYEIVASNSTDGQSCASTLTQVETCPGTGYTIDSATGLCVNSSGNTEKPNPCPTGYIPSFGECLGVTGATAGFTPSGSASGSGSSCPTGYTYNGTTCTASPTPNTTTTSAGSCPAGYTPSGSACTATGTAVTTTVYTCPNGSTVASSTDTCTATASCPTKYTLSGGACTASPACPANYTGPNSSGECTAGSPTTTTTTSSASCPYGYSWNGVNCSDTVNNTYYASLDATFSGDIYNTSDNTLQFYGSGDNIEIGSTPGWGGNIYYSGGNFYGSWYSTVTGATAVEGSGSSLVGEGGFAGSSINFSGGSFSGNIGSILYGSGDQIVGAGSIHSGYITASTYCPNGYYYIGGNECEENSSYTYTTSPTCSSGTYIGDYTCSETVYACPNGTTVSSSTSTCTASATCPNGSTATSDTCSSTPTCSTSGYTFNSTGDNCTASPTTTTGTVYDCPNGSTSTTSTCTASVSTGSTTTTYTCPNGTTVSSSSDICTATPTSTTGSSGTCPTGTTTNSSGDCVYTLNATDGSGDNAGTPTAGNQCLYPVCPSGYTFDTTTQMCVDQTQISGCAIGYTYCSTGQLNADGSCNTSATGSSGICSEVLTASACPQGYAYNSSNNTCSGQETTSLICPTAGTDSAYTLSGLTCTETLTQNTCASGYTFDTSNNTCTETTTEPACPNGTLSGTACTEQSSTTPICSNSEYYYDSSTDSCQPITQGASCPANYGGPEWDSADSVYDCETSPTPDTSVTPETYTCPNGTTVASSTDTCTATPTCSTGYSYNDTNNLCYPTSSVSVTCPAANIPSAGSSTQTESACPVSYSYNSSSNLCVNISTMSACPANWQIINGVCIDNACPYGQPEAQAPGQANSCVQTSSGAPYYCSPELCYNNAVNTPQPSLATMPAPQTNNGTVTKKGCTGQVYIFSGQAMQCTRYMLGNCCSHSKFAFGEGTCNAQDQTIANAIVHDANDDTSPNNPVPVYSGSGGNFGPTIGECSQNAIDNDGCGQLGEATYIGSYCSNKILGMCLDTYTYVFCKFNGLLATLIQAQGRAQLAGGPNAISWGTCTSSSNCSPNCTGFTPAQFQMLNFANMNLSEFVAVMTTQVKATLSSGALTNQIQNTTMSVTNEVTQIEGASTP